jgi:hypothetical protein
VREEKMLIGDLADELKRAYSTAPEDEKVVNIHLFAIKFAKEIEGKSCKDIAIRAGISKTYGTELRKGVNLAKYVRLKE